MNLERMTAGDAVLVNGGADSDLTRKPALSVYVGGAGAVRVTMEDGTDVLFSGVPAGTVLPIRVNRIWATNTTATLIIALYNP